MQTDDPRKPQGAQPQVSEQQPRKPYRAPTLEDLGTVTELTEVSAGNPKDGGGTGLQGSQI